MSVRPLPSPTDDLSPRRLMTLMLDTSAELQASLDELVVAGREWARAENEYRKARATSFLATEGRTVAEKDALTDKVTERERFAAHLADARRDSAREAVRSKRAILSALQSISSAVKEEMALARVGP